MNKEQQELLDEVYRKYADSHWTPPSNPKGKLLSDQLFSVVPMEHSKEEFINKCKTNNEFSKKWGLKIEERELSLEERNDVYKKQWESGASELSHDRFNSLNIPTKLITVTRELSLDERVKIFGVEKINTTDTGYYEHSYAQFKVDEANIPTTKKIESYE
jgi:hypothetical protein